MVQTMDLERQVGAVRWPGPVEPAGVNAFRRIRRCKTWIIFAAIVVLSLAFVMWLVMFALSRGMNSNLKPTPKAAELQADRSSSARCFWVAPSP